MQKSFDDAIRRSGQATAFLDGKKITISEVEQVAIVPSAQTSRYRALMDTAETLGSRASDINAAAGGPIAVNMSVVAVIRAKTPLGEVDIVAGSGSGLNPAQRAMLRQGEMAADNLPGMHAEQNAIVFISKNGWTPIAGGASQSVCSKLCAILIRKSGGLIAGEVYQRERGEKIRTFIWM